MTATPTKLRDGSWGARVQGSVAVGDSVTITTKGGKSWDATVTRVVWSGEGATIVATQGTDGGSRPKGASRACESCGHVERRNARGYVEGDWVRGGLCQSCREERDGGY